MQKCVDPPGKVVSSRLLLASSCKAIGADIAAKSWPLFTNVTTTQEYDATMESIMETAYNAWAAQATIAPLNPPSWTDFQKMPVWRWPTLITPQWDYQYQLGASPPTSGFTTASGLMEFVSPILSKGPKWLAANALPNAGGAPNNNACYGPGNLAVMAEWQSGAGDAFYSQDTSQYPILISTPHSQFRQHSWLDNNPMLQDNYRHAIWLSVADAQQRGISDGDLVHVYNNKGEMIIPAYVTSRLVPGTGTIYEASWYMPGAMKTALMPDGIDMRGNCNFIDRDIDIPYTIVGYLNCHGLCQVEKFSAETVSLETTSAATTVSIETTTTTGGTTS